MYALAYEAPTTLEAAVSALAKRGAGARVLAGGTDLLVQMRRDPGGPATVLDVKRIPELRRVALDDSGLYVGAAVSCWELSGREDVRALYPGLMEASELIGSMQIQGRATLGGNLCNGSPAADTTPALIALGASCQVLGPEGGREVPAEEFVRAPGETALKRDELLVAIQVPHPAPRSADAYLRFIPRAEMDIAVVGAGVSVTLDPGGECRAARIALGAVAPRPIPVPAAAEAVVATRLEEPDLERAAACAREASSPISDVRGSATYRRHLAGVLTRRALAIAAERARSPT